MMLRTCPPPKRLRCGFRVHGIIQNYVTDASCDYKAAFIVWRNPEYCDARRGAP